MRFMAAQFSALLADKLWLRNAEQANMMAARLAAGIAEIPGVKLRYPVQSNAVFVTLSPEHIAELQRGVDVLRLGRGGERRPLDDGLRYLARKTWTLSFGRACCAGRALLRP